MNVVVLYLLTVHKSAGIDLSFEDTTCCCANLFVVAQQPLVATLIYNENSRDLVTLCPLRTHVTAVCQKLQHCLTATV